MTPDDDSAEMLAFLRVELATQVHIPDRMLLREHVDFLGGARGQAPEFLGSY